MRVISLEQGTAAWKEFRKFKIGASMAPVIMDVSPWKTRLQLWEQIINDEEQVPTEAMIRGSQMEPLARSWANDYLGRAFEPAVIQHEIDWAIASLDGWDGSIALEIKCPGEKDHQEAKAGKVPEHYLPQLHHQMFVTGTKAIFYCSFFNGKGEIVIVDRDDKYIEKLFSEEKKFHDSLINFEQPSPTDRDFMTINDPIKVEKANHYAKGLAQLKALELEMDELKKDLIHGLNHPRVKFGNLKITKVVRPGNVDYKAIEELKYVNLEKYRKKPIESWRITSNE